MKLRLIAILTAFITTLSAMAQNKLFTLDDLIPGGSTYSSLLPDNRHFSFEGDKVVEQPNNRKTEQPNNRKTEIKDYNLFVNGQQVTTDGSADILYGQAVHRDEYGCTQGLFWSPNNNLLAFYRMDQSMVTHYPAVNITPKVATQCYPAKEQLDSRMATLEPDPYPMAGETSHLVTIGIYDPQKQKTIYLQTGDPTDRYFTNIGWNPDSRRIYVIELNRDVTDLSLQEYDATTGQHIRTLFTEHNDKYVEPLHPIQFLPWNASQFIYQSRKDGYNHIYLYQLEKEGPAQQVRQITQGSFEVLSVIGFAKSTKSIIYTSNESHPLNQSLYSVSTTSGKHIPLGNTDGWHANAQLSESGKFLIDSYSTPTCPRSIDLINTATGKARNLFTAKDKWVEGGYAIPEVRVGTIKAADGVTDLYYRLILPINFDPKNKYPTITYVYGGPHAHMIDARYNYDARGWDTYMAQRGYIMFTLDNRGSEHRGTAFEQATFRKLGIEEMRDQLCGVAFLKSLPYVDADRMGIHGWSFGGHMTTALMTSFVTQQKDPLTDGLFTGTSPYKVGVAGGPVIDWSFYEVMYGERYMDTPQTNPDGYRITSLLPKAANLQGRLMLIYGLNDPVCVPQHTLSFIRACIDAGTYPDLFTYPGDGHNMFGKDRIHLYNVITRYFEEHL